jgi:hypothetical protein
VVVAEAAAAAVVVVVVVVVAVVMREVYVNNEALPRALASGYVTLLEDRQPEDIDSRRALNCNRIV